ncbi:MAG: DNA-binding transcriptional ArsR family regulator [Candidatus Paceibacteria bacterium]
MFDNSGITVQGLPILDHTSFMSTEDIAPRLAALGNSTRLEIYRVLVRAGRPGLAVAGIQTRVQIPASTLSHHLRNLCQVGLVQQVREGTSLICHADFAVLESTFALFVRECCADEQGAQNCQTTTPPCC